MDRIIIERCSFCGKLRYFLVDEGIRSEWLESLPPGVSTKDCQGSVCTGAECVKRNIQMLEGHKKETKDGQECEAQEGTIIPIQFIQPFANQPRKHFNPRELQLLSESIREHGQLVPVIVRQLPAEEGSVARYELIGGERRYRACKMAGIKTMQAVVMIARDEEKQFTLSVIENCGRIPNNHVEIAHAIARFREFGKNTATIAGYFMKHSTWVTQHERLLKLDPKVLDFMKSERSEEERLAFATALLLVDLPKEEQLPIAVKVINGEFKHLDVKRAARMKAKQIGIPTTRSPSKDYVVLCSLLDRMLRDLNLWITYPSEFLQSIFEHRDASDHGLIVSKLEKVQVEIADFLTLVLRAKKAEVVETSEEFEEDE